MKGATPAPPDTEATEGDIVTVLEFDVDDMTGEEIALAAERLRAHAGVLDVSLAGRSGKKGRPVTEMRLLSAPAAATAVAHACFRETSTLGLRRREERRCVLRRTDVRLQLDERAVTVKLAQRPDGETSGKAAHDDTAEGASLAARRRMRERAVAAALSRATSAPPMPDER